MCMIPLSAAYLLEQKQYMDGDGTEKDPVKAKGFSTAQEFHQKYLNSECREFAFLLPEVELISSARACSFKSTASPVFIQASKEKALSGFESAFSSVQHINRHISAAEGAAQ